MLAKVCSDKNKPNGQYRIKPDREEVMSFVKNLPIRKVGDSTFNNIIPTFIIFS